MSPTRQDAWSQDEDLLLAEVVLRHIREGGTQLQAFEEVGKRLSRTSAACGFRWNSYVRKQYKSGIELAKKQRKELKKHDAPVVEGEPIQEPANVEVLQSPPGCDQGSTITFPAVIHFLEGLQKQVETSASFEEDRNKSAEKIKELEKKSYYLAAENERLAKNLKAIEEDYRSLIEIMERARKMVVLHDEDRQQKVKFQMDKNGNLERVEK
ncbi:putative spore coat protein regulator protein YlbO [Neobacillus bataviensis LMG 21833]|uniref:Putative spore coat protein regulator protein YlbO n=1 Tax=Neobacillus bataviensis LMG 21833 TaxID=1117379 RepID=K6DE33_9BACI|nr:RsfA family transcriptional regulator [Neobacillus bataviensis]EKN66323.1 putative spore coat protein regulator protein YlbO [Neobacillus bataviensis LMG 21833]